MVRWKSWLGTACLAVCGGCVFSYDVSCQDPPPYAVLLIDKARAPLIDHFTTEGACIVLDTPPPCNASNCAAEAADPNHTYQVKWLALGKCTVTATFSDGSPPLVQPYEFRKVCPT